MKSMIPTTTGIGRMKCLGRRINNRQNHFRTFVSVIIILLLTTARSNTAITTTTVCCNVNAFLPISQYHHRWNSQNNYNLNPLLNKKRKAVINRKHHHNHDDSNNNIIICFSNNNNSNEEEEEEENGSDSDSEESRVTTNDDVDVEIDSFLSVLGGNAANCIIESDLKRIGGGDGGGSSGWTSWVDEQSAMRLQSCMNQCQLYSTDSSSNKGKTMLSSDEQQIYDEALRYIRWMKATPSPTCIHLSQYLRQVVSNYLDTYDDNNYDNEEEHILNKIQSTKEEFLSRMGLQLFVMPSGSTFPTNLQTAPGALVYGQLLYGGATRFRILPGKMQRRTGERTSILPAGTQLSEEHKAWLQYGGPQRNYQAVDIGPCALLELTILPKGLSMDSSKTELTNSQNNDIHTFPWSPQRMLQFYDTNNDDDNNNTKIKKDSSTIEPDPTTLLDGKEWNDYVQQTFSTHVGGLETQIQSIVRRVLDGRVYRSIHDTNDNDSTDDNDDDDDDDDEDDKTTNNHNNRDIAREMAQMKKNIGEAKELELLGLSPVRGLLLYGPPGCGKTALARQISNILKARKPKIVAAPELLDRWVGGSEKLIRELFQDAEQELRICAGDATKSSLHVIVIDEIDAVFRKRTSSDDSGQVSRASAVNQILAKLDGINAIPNVLLIGMTNRRELLDNALLRPGRLEVQIEIPKPNQEGRRQILNIHFHALRQRGRLSQPLCQAIDGRNHKRKQLSEEEDDVTSDDAHKNSRSKRKKLLRNISNILQQSSTVIPNYHRNTIVDLADPIWTGGFTGADIAGLVRCAGSIALSRARKQGMGIDALLITLEDVHDALTEIKSNNNINNIKVNTQ